MMSPKRLENSPSTDEKINSSITARNKPFSPQTPSPLTIPTVPPLGGGPPLAEDYSASRFLNCPLLRA